MADGLTFSEQAADRWNVELQAAASLDHPHVVPVYDYGHVGIADAERSGGRLAPGRRFIVMEYVAGETLGASLGALSWTDCRRILLAILSGLGHAHARGVVHRDIKGGNILLGSSGDIKLADFGVAAVRGGAGAPDVVSGTPAYMAPEQWVGDWPDQGPWTDLYALGCLAWAMLTGGPPFGKTGGIAALGARHLFRPLSVLQTSVDVPPGLDAWLARLLAKSAAERPRTAAEAAAALRALDPGPAAPSETRRRGPQAEGVHLVGAGLGLFALRRPRLVGRDAALDRLAAELAAVQGEGVRHVRVGGDPGVGRSALLIGFEERTAEAGDALPLRMGSGEMAWQAPLEQLLRIQGVEGERRLECLLRRAEQPWPDRPLSGRIRALFTPRPMPPTGSLAHEMLVCDVLTTWSTERPLVLFADDAEPELLKRLDALAAEPRGLRALVVSAPRDGEASADVVLDNLGPAAEGRLLRDFGLDARLVARVAGVTGGNPGYAHRLLRSWIDAGSLVPGSVGFRLAPDVDLDRPAADLAVDWGARLREVLADRSEVDRAAVQLAALLGDADPPVLWRLACARAGVVAEPDLVRALVRQGVAVPRGAGWAFRHPALRAAGRVWAEDAGRAPALHLAAAAAFEDVGRVDDGERGRHLLAGGRPGEALAPLLAGLDRLRQSLRPLEATALADRLEECLTASAVPPRDRAWFELWRHRVSIGIGVGDVELQQAATRACRRHTDAAEDPTQDVECKRLEGTFEEFSGRLDAALALYGDAYAEARRLGSTEHVVLCGLRLGVVHGRQGRFDEALAMLDGVLAKVDPSVRGQVPLALEIIANRTHILSLAGRPADALTSADEGLRRGGDVPFGRMHAVLMAIRGRVLASLERLEEAEAELRRALELTPHPASPDARRTEQALLGVLLTRGSPEDTLAPLRRLRNWWERKGSLPDLLEAELLLLRAAAELGDEGEAGAALDRIEALMQRTTARSPVLLPSVRAAARRLRGDQRLRCSALAHELTRSLQST